MFHCEKFQMIIGRAIARLFVQKGDAVFICVDLIVRRLRSARHELTDKARLGATCLHLRVPIERQRLFCFDHAKGSRPPTRQKAAIDDQRLAGDHIGVG